jgi:hypothetical protein
MSPINIPKSAYAAIQHLIRFSAPDFDAFLDALSKAEPSLDQDNFWKHVAKHVNRVDQAAIESILHQIFQMDDARVDAARDGLGLNEFAEAVAEAAASSKSKEFPFEEGDRKILKDRLVRIFEGRKGLKITMKAMGVLLDQDHVFYHARILTDIRPVFNDKGDSVDAAVIVHNLRIHYGENSDHKDFYVALDTNDIQSLREVLDRADAKAKCLLGLLKTSGVSYLDAEE